MAANKRNQICPRWRWKKRNLVSEWKASCKIWGLNGSGICSMEGMNSTLVDVFKDAKVFKRKRVFSRALGNIYWRLSSFCCFLVRRLVVLSCRRFVVCCVVVLLFYRWGFTDGLHHESTKKSSKMQNLFFSESIKIHPKWVRNVS